MSGTARLGRVRLGGVGPGEVWQDKVKAAEETQSPFLVDTA